MSDTAIRRSFEIEVSPDELGDIFAALSSKDQVEAICAALDGLLSIGGHDCDRQLHYIAEEMKRRITDRRQLEALDTIAAFFKGAR